MTIFENRSGKTIGEFIFEFVICAVIGGLIGAALIYGAGMEPLYGVGK